MQSCQNGFVASLLVRASKRLHRRCQGTVVCAVAVRRIDCTNPPI